MKILLFPFLVCLVALAWRWHNEPASRRAEPDPSPPTQPAAARRPASLDGERPLARGAGLRSAEGLAQVEKAVRH